MDNDKAAAVRAKQEMDRDIVLEVMAEGLLVPSSVTQWILLARKLGWKGPAQDTEPRLFDICRFYGAPHDPAEMRRWLHEKLRLTAPPMKMGVSISRETP